MNDSILTWLRRQSDTMPVDMSPTLGNFVLHWRDRLQTDEARAALTDDLVLENTVDETKEASRIEALRVWSETAEAAWLAYAGVADEAALTDAVQTALAEDTLAGWASAHDVLGACGVASVDEILGLETCKCCFSAARLMTFTEVPGPPGMDGQPTTVREYKTYDTTVSALQLSLRDVLVSLCSV